MPQSHPLGGGWRTVHGTVDMVPDMTPYLQGAWLPGTGSPGIWARKWGLRAALQDDCLWSSLPWYCAAVVGEVLACLLG